MAQEPEVFDESRQACSTLSLFAADREIPAEATNGIQVKLREMELRRARAFGNCWLGCELWRQLQLDEFWHQPVHHQQAQHLLPGHCFPLHPGSEFRLHR